ncbi:hypothetical protein DsansV1_C15g0134681 [Dioscorea sansibarensis]
MGGKAVAFEWLNWIDKKRGIMIHDPFVGFLAVMDSFFLLWCMDFVCEKFGF